MIEIDDKNIKTEWGLEPKYDGYYSNLLKPFGLKERVSTNWTDQNGLDVLYSNTRKKHKEIVLMFISDNYNGYKEFVEYLVAHQGITLHDYHLGISFNLEYMECSSYKYYREYNLFGIKFRQNPKEDTYLATSNDEGILTSIGDSIIVN